MLTEQFRENLPVFQPRVAETVILHLYTTRILGGEHSQTIDNIRFVDADGNETQACPDAELNRCISNGGNLFFEDPIAFAAELFSGCVLFDSPWVSLGVDMDLIVGLVDDGLIELGLDETVGDVFAGIQATFTAFDSLTSGCIDAGRQWFQAGADLILSLIHI